MPNMRGRIERILRTIDIKLLCYLAGRTFANIDERGKYNPANFASLTLEQLAVILVLYVVDVYHNEPHESIGGRTPGNEFDRLCLKGGTKAPPDATRRRNAFGVHLERTITKRGVRVLNLFFNSPALNQYLRRVGDGHKTEVIFSTYDLGTVSVRIGTGTLINVPCVTPELKGVNATVWIAACEDMRRRFGKENIPSEAIALATLADIIAMGDAARLAANIASPIINAKTVERFEKMIEIPWRSREAALANPNAGGDFMVDLKPSNPKGDFQPPIEPPPVREPRTAPQDWSDVDPETGEITPQTPPAPPVSPTPPASPASPTNPEDGGNTDLPEGWTLED
jgi:putative transposase